MAKKETDTNKEKKVFWLWRMICSIWKVYFGILNFAQGIVAIIFLVLIVTILTLVQNGDVGKLFNKKEKTVVSIQDGAALLINPEGVLMDYIDQNPDINDLIGEVTDNNTNMGEISVHKIVKAIKLAKDNDKVSSIVLRLQDLRIPSYAAQQMHYITLAIEDFKSSGKKVYASGDFYTQEQYLIAASADEIWMEPMGSVWMSGYGRYKLYRKALLEKLKVSSYVFRVGKYKSALEPVLRNDMSPEAKEANVAFITSMWNQYADKIEDMRGLAPSTLSKQLDNFSADFEKSQGDFGQWAVQRGLVDKLLTREERIHRLIDLVGKKKEVLKLKKSGKKEKSKKEISDDKKKAETKASSLSDISTKKSLADKTEKKVNKYSKDDIYNYIQWTDFLSLEKNSKDFSIYEKIGDDDDLKSIRIINVNGVIIDGERQSGFAAGDYIANQLRDARFDDNVAAVVLRVDSPGGSAYASEIINREIIKIKEVGKPVVSSFASLAASGGYWVAAQSDYIVASPSTITGSIGIYGYFQTYEKALKWAGVTSDGVGTSKLTDVLALPYMKLSGDVANLIQQSVDKGYRDFIKQVATGRHLKPEYVEEIAQGRVWIGKKALELKLVDELGDISTAIAKAAELAKLDNYSVYVPHSELSDWDKILQEIINDFDEKGIKSKKSLFSSPSFVELLEKELAKDKIRAKSFNDPYGIYVRCLDCLQ